MGNSVTNTSEKSISAIGETSIAVRQMISQSLEHNLLSSGKIDFDSAQPILEQHLEFQIRNASPPLCHYTIPLSQFIGSNLCSTIYLHNNVPWQLDNYARLEIEVWIASIRESPVVTELIRRAVRFIVKFITENKDEIGASEMAAKYPGFQNTFESYHLVIKHVPEKRSETSERLVDLSPAFLQEAIEFPLNEVLPQGWYQMTPCFGFGDYMRQDFIFGKITIYVTPQLYDESADEADSRNCEPVKLVLDIEGLTARVVIDAAMEEGWDLAEGEEDSAYIDSSLYRIFAIGKGDDEEGRIVDMQNCQEHEKSLIPYIYFNGHDPRPFDENDGYEVHGCQLGMLGDGNGPFELKACLISVFGETNLGELLM